jgi:hypothetical protein
MTKKRVKSVYFTVVVLFLGVVFFGLSLLSVASATKLQMHNQNRVIYFDRTVMPDHLFYPFVVAVDRLELELSGAEEKIVLRMDYAQKRLEAAKVLFSENKGELAFTTLMKAHHYLLQANENVLALKDKSRYLTFLVKLNENFVLEYENLRKYMDDSQRATLDRILLELHDMEGKL